MAAEFAYDYDYMSAAPAVKPQSVPQKKPDNAEKPELRKLRKPREDVRRQTVASHLAVARFFAVVAVVMAAFIVLCASFSQLRASRIAYNEQVKLLGIYQNDQKQVEARLAKLVSVDKIEKIAVEKLGMIKISDDNVIYIDTADENEIITADTE